jgi:hypothetical protein
MTKPLVPTVPSGPTYREACFAPRRDSISFWELRASTCRWPLGDAPIRFCGRQALWAGGYCKEHDKIGKSRVKA